jgi:hypothetical protein
VAHASEGPVIFARNPNAFYSQGAKLSSPAGIPPAAPESAASNLPPAALPSLQDMVGRLATQQNVGDSDIGQLAAARAQYVKDYLAGQGVPAERVLSDGSIAGSAPRVTLQLK